jgi:hypothetical protein
VYAGAEVDSGRDAGILPYVQGKGFIERDNQSGEATVKACRHEWRSSTANLETCNLCGKVKHK